MAQRRTIILDDSEVIMVVRKDVVSQLDEHRGEMNRTEFVNFLIQSQLKEYEDEHTYVNKDEFQRFAREITGLFHSFLELFLCKGLGLNEQSAGRGIIELSQHLDDLNGPAGTDSAGT